MSILSEIPQDIVTPAFVYDIGLLRKTLAEIDTVLGNKPAWHLHYAVKANNNKIIVEEIAKSEKIGADCVSIGEIRWVIENGFRVSDIMFAGVGKTSAEIKEALELGIGCFNVESEPELENINRIATAMGVKAPVALRVNPDIDAHTHPGITTGTYEDQFGIPYDHIDKLVPKALGMTGISLKGLHFHIGSQITDMKPFGKLCSKINDLQDYWNARGVFFSIINVGGGLGIDYENPDVHPIADFKDYFRTFENLKLRKDQELHFELGRAIVAQCGSLVTRVMYVKEGANKKFAIVDGGFNCLIRPALYDAYHRIDVINPSGAAIEHYDVVGPICESTDCFAREFKSPTLHSGDLLAIRSAGAYGETMSSNYNMRGLPSSVYINL